MTIVPKCCACASHGPTSQYPKPHDQLFSTISLYGNAKSRTMALLLPEESKKLHIGGVKVSACSTTDAIQSKANFYSNSLHEESTSGSIQFDLLMENLNEIEELLGSKELELLERNIQLQIKQLGALKLYHDCLSRNLASRPLKPYFRQLEVPVIVRRGKSQERKLKPYVRECLRLSHLLPNHIQILKVCKRAISGFSRLGGEVQIVVLQKKNVNFQRVLRDQLVQCTQPLVMFIAKKYRGLGISFVDLLQTGNLGLLKGAEKFDSNKGYRFSTYIRHWIRKAIFELIAENSRIFRMSVRAECMVQKIEKVQGELYFNLGRYPSDEETAKFTGFTLANVRLAMRCSQSIFRSLEKPIRHGSSITLKDIISDKSLEGCSSINIKQLKNELLFILEELNPREKHIIAQRYGLNDDGICRSLEEVGKHFNVSKEWIRKLEKRAIAKLRRDDIKDNVRRLLHLYN